MASAPDTASDQDPRDPHALAVDIQTDLHKLATIIAHAGASPQAVQELTKMGDVMGQVVKALGSPGAAQPGQPGPAQPPQQAQPPQVPPGPAQPPQAPRPPQGQGPPQSGHQALHHATKALQHAVAQNAAQQQQGR